MSNVKNIVKVMNFHSLLRVDKSKKTAEKYFNISKELDKMIGAVIYNKNLNLDKKILKSNERGKIIDIYLGNDLGFCGNFNTKVNLALKESEKDSYKIIIGKKIHIEDSNNILLKISKEEFLSSGINEISQIIRDILYNNDCKEINVFYNKYNNINNINFVKQKLFPFEFMSEQENVNNYDFVIETDVNKLITSMIALYIIHQIKIMEQNSYASENVMRQKITRESLKKINELEEEKEKEERKKRKYIAFQKQINNYKGIGSE